MVPTAAAATTAGLGKLDRVLFGLIIVPLLIYCLWTKWAVTTSTISLGNSALIDFLRLNGAYYAMMAVWCGLMLKPDKGLSVIRIFILFATLYFAATDLSYSAAVYYTGSLAPFDVSYYSAQAVGKLPFSISTTELLTLVVLPVIFIATTLWKLRRIYQTGSDWKPYSSAILLLLLCAAIPPLNTTAEANLFRPSYIYQIAEFTEKKTILAQAIATEEYSTKALSITANTEQHPNIVIIALESVGAQSTGLYNPDRTAVTPNLNALAQTSLVAKQAYTVVPHTSKALVAINCGITPNFMHPVFESTFGTHQPCLPALLDQQGYATAFFQSPTEHFENRRGTVTKMGYQHFVANEQLDHNGFQMVNYFGYEDDILLQPSKQWLQQQDAPFMAFYLTGTTHHPYWVPDSLEQQAFEPEDEEFNDYLNAVHYLDRFVGKLIQQYRDTGHYDNTVFVIVGDHGESLGQHFRMQHNVNLYQEVMQVPLLIHSALLPPPLQAPKLASQLDIVPTLLTLAGYEPNRTMEGFNLLDPAQARKYAMSDCWYDDWCMASTDGGFKYIHNFDEKQDELYDLNADPLELHNIITQHPQWASEQRQALLQLKARNRQQWHGFLSSQDAHYWDKRDATLGTPIGLMQMAQDDPRLQPSN